MNLKLLSFVTVQRARALLTKGKHGESFTLKNILNVSCVCVGCQCEAEVHKCVGIL